MPLRTDEVGLLPNGADLLIFEEEVSAHRVAGWDAYVADATSATFFHRAGWSRTVAEIYGHRPRHLVARDPKSGRIVGLLPLFEASGPMTGRALISIPYAVSGGAVAEDPAIESGLIARAKALAHRLDVGYLEIRGPAAGDGLVIRDHYVGFRDTMPNDPAQVLGRFPRKARAEIRKARDQHGLKARFGHELLETFYGLYVRSLRRLGSPGHSRRFFRRLIEQFGDDCLVEVVDHQGAPAAGVLSFRFRDQILPYYAGIDVRYNHLNVSNYLYYALMERAVAMGLGVFDFGRTRRDNLGGCQFKINQGFEPEAMPYHFYSTGGIEPPDLRPSNASFSRPRDLWRRLPLRVAGPLGGFVSRWLP